MADGSTKAEGALRTISEVSDQFGVPQHILRYWETRFPQLRPLQRAGNRRYYRPEDVALVQRIHDLLNREGYTIKGVQKLLSARRGAAVKDEGGSDQAPAATPTPASAAPALSPAMVAELRAIRDTLASALLKDAA